MLDPDAVQTVGLLVKTHHPQALATTLMVLNQVAAAGWRAVIPESLHEQLREKVLGPVEPRPVEALGRDIDLLIVLGGDGTFLQGVRLISPRPIPILGVNLGRLGFLTEVTVEEVPEVFQFLAKGELPLESRAVLETAIRRAGGETLRHRVLNDAVIGKTVLARIIDLGIRIDGEEITHLRADGLIVATPTGSTAYSMAASGAIVHPGIPCILLTPICPHTLTQRPIVIPDRAVVEAYLEAPHDDVYVSFDGQQGTRLTCGDRVIVKRADWNLRYVSHPHRSFYQVLRTKLKWGEF